ncbi:MAG: hypothetical protein R3F46_04715 [bacterium]
MNRILLIAGLLLLLALLGLLLPPMLQRSAVRSALLELSDAVREADLNGVQQGILPAQRQLADDLIGPLLPAHGSSLRHTRIRSMERLAADRYSVEVVFSFDDPSWGRQLIEGRMLMQRDGGLWLLDLQSCEARQFSINGDGDWTSAVDWLTLAQP